MCHLGPTNSGKTFSALQALKSAESGVYCGPLRLLAWEVYDQLNTADVPCKLVTGQEILPAFGGDIINPQASTLLHGVDDGCFDSDLVSALHKSSTIEMTDTKKSVEVAVIDEIQLLADSQRGWAWTRALLGVPSLEVHVCGEPSVEGLVQKMCEETGDDMDVIRYDRLSPLEVQQKPLFDVKNVRPGDCLIAFSRREAAVNVFLEAMT